MLSFIAVSVFSIFLGSQITEGCLLVPFWKSLSKTDFYEYYARFGPIIGRFYTVLTIIAVCIPITLSMYCFRKKTSALKTALTSTFFSLLVIVVFYVYFKPTNTQFYEAVFNSDQLKIVLQDWENWHWLRVFFECMSLLFLIISFHVLQHQNNVSK